LKRLSRLDLNVLAMLAEAPAAPETPAPPQQTELRDGQIYRWVC
jgi:hypothetical protein